MKQSAAKTLGVAVLGAAFAAAGAGAATAAPELPDTSRTVDTVARTLPAVQPFAEQVVAEQLSDAPTGPVAGLLGGLPAQGLPTQGLGVNGLPLGG
ncbi:ATP-binding protein [Streptomyces sp. NPDC006367]|uniref:ATP-binding protein n=1 Tax=unclassified Streptomyces TaxID=2593676 RepID=UPI0033BEBA27